MHLAVALRHVSCCNAALRRCAEPLVPFLRISCSVSGVGLPRAPGVDGGLIRPSVLLRRPAWAEARRGASSPPARRRAWPIRARLALSAPGGTFQQTEPPRQDLHGQVRMAFGQKFRATAIVPRRDRADARRRKRVASDVRPLPARVFTPPSRPRS